MRVVDQSNGHGRIDVGSGIAKFIAWLGLATIAISGGAGALADGPPGPEQAEAAADPIALSGEKVRVWDVGADHWVSMDGHSAVLWGIDGLRADRIVAKIHEDPGQGDEGNLVELYAEGNVVEVGGADRSRKPSSSLTRSLRATKGLSLRSFEKSGVRKDAAPPRDLPILSRAFRAPRSAPIGAVAASPRGISRPSTGIQPPPPGILPPLPAEGQSAPAPRAEGSRVDPAVVRTGGIEPVPASVVPTVATRSDYDPEVKKAQDPADDPFPNQDPPPEMPEEREPISPPPAEGPRVVEPPDDDPDRPAPGPTRRPGPPIDVPDVPPSELPEEKEEPAKPREIIPIAPETLRTFTITPRDGGVDPRTGQPLFRYDIDSSSPDGTVIFVIKGGVNIICELPKKGTVDLSADSIVLWTKRAPNGSEPQSDGEGKFAQDEKAPLEAYLEGNVVVRMDGRKLAGNADAKDFRAPVAYYNINTERFLAIEANGQKPQADLFGPGLTTPMNVKSTEINQFRPTLRDDNGKTVLGRTVIRAERTTSTASRFPNPGYKFTSKSLDIYQLNGPDFETPEGIPIGFGILGMKSLRNRTDEDFEGKGDLYRVDGRQNAFFTGPVPIFYSPRFLADSDDLSPALRQIGPRYIQYFGFQILLDFNAFKLFNLKKPSYIDDWALDIDWLQKRGPAVGTGLGWFGKDPLWGSVTGAYYGYFDFWGILDHYTIGDDLGPGPAVVTNGPPGSGKKARQRTNAPFYNQDRGRFTARHMQSFLADDAPDDEDFRLALEFNYQSDRNFLEQYYKYLFDAGLDQWTDAYLIKQKENRAFTVLGQANLQYWFTDTQYFPKLDYYRLGDTFLNNHVNVSGSYGIDYANVHTATEVNNPNIFAFIPYDPVSNTSGPFQSGRAYVAEQVDFPINLDYVRIDPYLQGQLAAWDDQIGNQALGRAWGAYGIKLDAEAWRRYPTVESELFNVHGLNHKINFDVDARFAYSNVGLNQIGVQDQIDDNTYEWSRRYFALTNYSDGILPMQYDPRYLTLRRAISPITGSADILASMQTVKLGIHQRLQTKRGPEGKKRVVDYMVFDLTTTYFPDMGRDNFNKPFGQNMYNYEWYIGDRTSIISQGWFEEFNIGGNPTTISNPRNLNDPFAFSIINTGISINRPPRGSMYIAYSVINSGPITTSALLTTTSYWLSPKWYGTLTNSYDFGNAILLGTTASMTRIGADWLTSIGIAFDPQRNASQISLELTPRISPNVRLGSSGAASRFDSRFAPTQ